MYENIRQLFSILSRLRYECEYNRIILNDSQSYIILDNNENSINKLRNEPMREKVENLIENAV